MTESPEGRHLRPLTGARMIRPMKIRAAVMVLAVSFAVQSHASSDAAARGKDLIEQATAKMNIFDLPSFRMNANVRIDNFGKPLDGTYSLSWNGPDQWREEIRFSGYSEVQRESEGMLYLKRSSAFMPYTIFQLHSTLGFGSTGFATSFFNRGPQGHESIKAIHEKKVGGIKSDCVEIQTELKFSREVCIDAKTGVLNRAGQHLLDGDFAAIGEKVFPRSLVSERDGKRLVEIHVTELRTGEPFQSSLLFEPPQPSVSRHGCMNPTPGNKIKDVAPVYPMEDKMSRKQGRVGLYAIVDESGTPQQFKNVLSASPGLDQSAQDAIAKWRYSPATCNGSPVAVETVVEVVYELQY